MTTAETLYLILVIVAFGAFAISLGLNSAQWARDHEK